MKYGKIKDGLVVLISNKPKDGCVEIIKKWSTPTEYDDYFYYTESNIPRLAVVGEEIHETWVFRLKVLDEIKSQIYKILKGKRKEKRMSPFNVNGVMVSFDKDKTFNDVDNLNTSATSFKIRENEWVESAVKVSALRRAAKIHSQDCFDWELEQNKLVNAMTTVDKLKIYLDSI